MKIRNLLQLFRISDYCEGALGAENPLSTAVNAVLKEDTSSPFDLNLEEYSNILSDMCKDNEDLRTVATKVLEIATIKNDTQVLALACEFDPYFEENEFSNSVIELVKIDPHVEFDHGAFEELLNEFLFYERMADEHFAKDLIESILDDDRYKEDNEDLRKELIAKLINDED